MFHANEHEPVHVHGKCQGRECRARIEVQDGKVAGVSYSRVRGRAELAPAERRLSEALASIRAEEIVQRWIDFFVLNRPIVPQRIHRRLR